MIKIKEIYITKEKLDSRFSDFSNGIIYVCENGDVYTGLTTDMIEPIKEVDISVNELLRKVIK